MPFRHLARNGALPARLRRNGLLRPAVKQEVERRLTPRTKELFNEFHVCPICGRIYWKGSHYKRMQSLIDSVTAKS